MTHSPNFVLVVRLTVSDLKCLRPLVVTDCTPSATAVMAVHRSTRPVGQCGSESDASASRVNSKTPASNDQLNREAITSDNVSLNCFRSQVEMRSS